MENKKNFIEIYKLKIDIKNIQNDLEKFKNNLEKLENNLEKLIDKKIKKENIINKGIAFISGFIGGFFSKNN